MREHLTLNILLVLAELVRVFLCYLDGLMTVTVLLARQHIRNTHIKARVQDTNLVFSVALLNEEEENGGESS